LQMKKASDYIYFLADLLQVKLARLCYMVAYFENAY
jgi:hypothetical protein